MNTEDKINAEELIKLGFVLQQAELAYTLYQLFIEEEPQMFYIGLRPANTPNTGDGGYYSNTTSLSELKQAVITFKTEEMARKKLPKGEKKKQLRIHVKENIIQNAGGDEQAVEFAETCLESNFGKTNKYKQRKK